MWLGETFLHIAWRRYAMTYCGRPIKDKEEALARGGERYTQGYPTCEDCKDAERLLENL